MHTESTEQLFISVDVSYDHGVVFTFPTAFYSEATNRIVDLGAYLHFHHGPIILIKHFKHEAAARAQESEWKPELGRAISNMDTLLESYLDDTEPWMIPPPQPNPNITAATPTQPPPKT